MALAEESSHDQGGIHPVGTVLAARLAQCHATELGISAEDAHVLETLRANGPGIRCVLHGQRQILGQQLLGDEPVLASLAQLAPAVRLRATTNERARVRWNSVGDSWRAGRRAHLWGRAVEAKSA